MKEKRFSRHRRMMPRSLLHSPAILEAKAEASRRKVPKSLVVQRLTEAGKIGLAKAALESDPAAFARWFAPGHTYVFADDPDALALLAAIGANADSIMAP